MPLPTETRLLAAALKHFALSGYEGASTRQITQEAKANISAIPYYFKSKEGLYRAVLAHIAAIVKKDLTEEAQLVREALARPRLSQTESQILTHRVLSRFVRLLVGGKVSPSMARIFLREQMEPTASFRVFYEETMRPMHEILTALLARGANLPYPSEQATLAAHAILGQVVIFKTHREAALRRLGWRDYGEKEVEKIIATVLTHTDFILTAYRKGQGRAL